MARRLLALPLLLFIVATALWWLMRFMTGGPQSRFAGARGFTSADIDAWLVSHCLSVESRLAPDFWGVLREYGTWLGVWDCERQSLLSAEGVPYLLPGFLGGGSRGVLHLDFGYSLDSGRTVVEEILLKAPITLAMTVPALIIAIAVTVAVGVLSARRARSFEDRALEMAGLAFGSMPAFWLGQVLLIVFAIRLGIFPVGGLYTYGVMPAYGSELYWPAFLADPVRGIIDLSAHLALPWATLALVTVGLDSRYVRASLIETLRETFVLAARARGLSEERVVYKHALRNALSPYVTRVGLQVPLVFAGSVGVERVFRIEAMGTLFIQSLATRDYFVLIDVLIVMTVLIIVVNLIVDVLYAVIDPRIRYA